MSNNGVVLKVKGAPQMQPG